MERSKDAPVSNFKSQISNPWPSNFCPLPMESAHLTWHPHSVTREDRERLNGHRGCVVWFTGLSGCGKSTVANLVERMLYARGVHSFLLDGDNVRQSLNPSPAMLA